MMRAMATRRGKAVAALIALAIALGLGLLGTRNGMQSPAAPAEKLIIAIPVLPHFMLMHVAAINGYFADEGLDVTVLPAKYGSVAITDVVQGRADIASGAEPVFVIALLQGNDLAVVASIASIVGDNIIVARRDHAIANAGDLRSKKIGVTFGTSGSYFLWAFLIRNKLAPDSIERVDLPPDRLAAALAEGSVDAISAWLPVSSKAQAALGDNAVSFTQADVYKTTILAVGHSEFLKSHSGAMQKLVRALLKAEQFMRLHPEETQNLAAAWLNLDVAALRPMWNEFDFRVNLLQSQLNAMEDETHWAMEFDHAAGPAPNFLARLNLDALLAVQRGRVTVLH
jgi:ABC-type nitrate/sulfonate/bicarbonate transport system substrate-binding protein